MSARSESQSTILPLPSSPHWAPITTTFAIAGGLQSGASAVDASWRPARYSAPRPGAEGTGAARRPAASPHAQARRASIAIKQALGRRPGHPIAKVHHPFLVGLKFYLPRQDPTLVVEVALAGLGLADELNFDFGVL